MPLLLGDIVRRHAAYRPAKTAYVIGGHRVTYAGLNATANRFAHLLRARGVGRGTRVATLARNRVEYPAIYFAAAKLGAIHVPLNVRWRAGEVETVLAHCGATVLLHDDQFADLADALRPALRHTVSLDRDAPALLAASDAEPDPEPALDERDPHVCLYTSGSTGDPKGALLSHRAYVLQAAQTQGTVGLGEDDVGLCMFPMFHMGGWAMPLGYWASGGTVVLVEKAEPEQLLRLAVAEGATYLYLIPTLYRAVLDLPGFDGADVSRLRALGSGTAAMTAAQVEEIVARFRNPNLFVMYGQTEAGPVATLRPPDVRRKPTSVGRPAANVEVRVVDADGADAAPGTVGEIVCRSEYTMLGYWSRPEATAEAFRGGWLHTGDLGAFDDQGFLHIAGRLRDVIRSAGESVFPAEVERCLLEHPGIAEAAVFGVPDPDRDEAVVAAVVPRAGISLADAEVIDHVRARLASYKKPRHVYVVGSFPRTASTRQVQKALLREEWLQAQRCRTPGR